MGCQSLILPIVIAEITPTTLEPSSGQGLADYTWNWKLYKWMFWFQRIHFIFLHDVAFRIYIANGDLQRWLGSKNFWSQKASLSMNQWIYMKLFWEALRCQIWLIELILTSCRDAPENKAVKRQIFRPAFNLADDIVSAIRWLRTLLMLLYPIWLVSFRLHRVSAFLMESNRWTCIYWTISHRYYETKNAKRDIDSDLLLYCNFYTLSLVWDDDSWELSSGCWNLRSRLPNNIIWNLATPISIIIIQSDLYVNTPLASSFILFALDLTIGRCSLRREYSSSDTK